MDLRGVIDVYINDVIALTVDINDNVKRMEGSTLLIIDSMLAQSKKTNLCREKKWRQETNLKQKQQQKRQKSYLDGSGISNDYYCHHQPTTSLHGQNKSRK